MARKIRTELDPRREMKMKIGLDFDSTYTADPGLWDKFIELAHDRGHEVHVVTSRYAHDHEDFYKQWEGKEINSVLNKAPVKGIHCTGREGKDSYMIKKGIQIHVWIDDDPTWIVAHRPDSEFSNLTPPIKPTIPKDN